MNLKSIILSAKHQIQKATYFMSPFIENVQTKKINRQKADQWLRSGGSKDWLGKGTSELSAVMGTF